MTTVVNQMMNDGREWAQGIWLEVLAQYDTKDIEFYGGIILQLITFWLPVLFFTALDLLPPNLQPFQKLQSFSVQPSRRQILHGYWICMRNNIIATGLLGLRVYYGKGGSRVSFSPKLPTLWEITWQFVYASLVREVYFYWIHRAFHSKLLYARFHKFHHRFTAPVASAAQYAGVVEHIFANTLPVVGPHAILGPKIAHVTSFWVFVGSQLFESVYDHCGYELPGFRIGWGGGAWLKSPSVHHDKHHELFDCYFSPLSVLDWIHGTDEKGMRERRRVRREAREKMANGKAE